MVRDNIAVFKAVSCAHAISLYRPSEREYRKDDTKKKSLASTQVSTQTDMKLSKSTSTLIVFIFFPLLSFVASKSNLVFTLSHFLHTTSHTVVPYSSINLQHDPPATDFIPTHQSLSFTYTPTYTHKQIHKL